MEMAQNSHYHMRPCSFAPGFAGAIAGHPRPDDTVHVMTLMNTALRSVPLLALMLAILPSQATFAAGDADNGEQLAYTCMGCHGIEGYRNAYPSYRVPRLGGQRAEYIVDALRAYRDGARPHPTMQAQGGSLSDQDFEDLAAFFQGETAAADEVTTADVAGIEAAATCLQCHGTGSEAVVPKPPVLAGQHYDYLVHSLNRYKDGERSGNVMVAFAMPLSEEAIEALARFYSEIDGLYTPDAD